MKKTILFAATLLGAAFYSCEDAGVTPDANGLVDVVFEVQQQEYVLDGAQTRLHVTPAGVTSWSPGDEVTIVDHGEGNYGQRFLYTGETTTTSGRFAGQLLAGYGTRVYYAYRKPVAPIPFSRIGHTITLGRNDIDINQGDMDIREVYGDYSSMVSVPREFNAESPNGKYLSFHHLNCLIEASISSKPSDRRIESLEFDAVEFIVEATGGAVPFSTEVKFDMTQIQGPTSSDPDISVVIPFTDNDDTKVDRMHTVLRYSDLKTIGDFTGLGTNSTFGIAIVALPTDTYFDSRAIVRFWNGDQVVGQLIKESREGRPARGLRVSGLNIINFSEDDWASLAEADYQGEDNNGQ